MKFQTLSIISGSAACNASCPFCISQMTGNNTSIEKINWKNFDKACRFSQIHDITNVIITGKGEPTLYPDLITKYLEHLSPFNFPIVELQTNGLVFVKNPNKYIPLLKKWYSLGLTIISISVVHYDPEINRQNYAPLSPSYPDLKNLIANLHLLGYTVRLSTTLLKNYLDSSTKINGMITVSKNWKVDQLTLRQVAMPQNTANEIVSSWTKAHLLSTESTSEITKYLDTHGHRLITYDYGGALFDVDGQNVCFTNALTLRPQTEDIRQAIFYPDGHLRFDWQYNGAIIF